MVFAIPLYLAAFVDFEWSQLPEAVPHGQSLSMGVQTNAVARVTNEVYLFPKTVKCISECALVEWFCYFLLVPKIMVTYTIFQKKWQDVSIK